MSLLDRAGLWVHHSLPARLLGRAAHSLARSEQRWLSRLLVLAAVRAYRPDLSEAAQSDPTTYQSFNAFFTRALKAGARPLEEASVLCPADGLLCASGAIQDGHALQAKGLPYQVAELLDDVELAGRFDGGWQHTIYLAPRDYHRVHCPLDGQWLRWAYVPGRLFSVQPFTVARIPRLFARNERLVAIIEDQQGRLAALVMVAAVLVSGIESAELGAIDRKGGRQRGSFDHPRPLRAGDEFGRFNYGSTVILLLDRRFGAPRPALLGSRLRVGMALHD